MSFERSFMKGILMKKIMLLGVACLLAGCATLDGVTTDMTTKWAGKSYDEFVMEYGIAQNSHKLSNGMTMYMWQKEGVRTAYGTANIQGAQKSITTVHCTLNILVDKNNNIKSIKASGYPDICPAK